MYIAKDESGKRIYITKANKNSKYYCPMCNEELILKQGQVKRHHFSHKTTSNCEAAHKPMTEWHFNWQEKFSEEFREVVIEIDIPEDLYRSRPSNMYESLEEYNDFCIREQRGQLKSIKVKHRADICANGYVVEFQHSNISEIDFMERNWFYNLAGYNVIWVIDMKEQIHSGNMKFIRKKSENKLIYSLDKCKKYLTSVFPQNSKYVSIIFDTGYKCGNDELILYIDWASPNKYIEDSVDYKRFIASNLYKDCGLHNILRVSV